MGLIGVTGQVWACVYVGPTYLRWSIGILAWGEMFLHSIFRSVAILVELQTIQGGFELCLQTKDQI